MYWLHVPQSLSVRSDLVLCNLKAGLIGNTQSDGFQYGTIQKTATLKLYQDITLFECNASHFKKKKRFECTVTILANFNISLKC